MHRIAAERLRSTRIDGYIAPSNGFEHSQRVAGRVLQTSVAMHGADAEELEAWTRCAYQDGECVVVTYQLGNISDLGVHQ